MLETSVRLLRLLTLLQSRRYWSGDELSARLDVTTRTLRRDVDKLRSLGYPIDSSSGPAGGYSLGAGASLPPLLLEDDEALAVALGLRMAALNAVTGMEEAGLRALTKLEQMMPARLRKRIRGLHAAVAPMSMAGPAVDAERLSALAAACRDEACVAFGYEAQNGERSQRDVEPHALVCAGSRWYLVGWDRARTDWRTFRVDRVAGAIACGPRFRPRRVPGGDPAAYVSRSVSSAQYPLRARILLHAPLERMAQHISPLAGQLERVDADRCVLVAGARSAAVLVAHMAAFDVEFEVLEPPVLVNQLRQMARRLSQAADGSRDVSADVEAEP